MKALVLHFPLHMCSPGLLTHQATTATAVNHLEGGEVRGVVIERDKAARVKQFKHFLLDVLTGGLRCVFSTVLRRAMAAGLTD